MHAWVRLFVRLENAYETVDGHGQWPVTKDCGLESVRVWLLVVAHALHEWALTVMARKSGEWMGTVEWSLVLPGPIEHQWWLDQWRVYDPHSPQQIRSEPYWETPWGKKNGKDS
jgi:hypothetical protein